MKKISPIIKKNPELLTISTEQKLSSKMKLLNNIRKSYIFIRNSHPLPVDMLNFLTFYETKCEQKEYNLKQLSVKTEFCFKSTRLMVPEEASDVLYLTSNSFGKKSLKIPEELTEAEHYPQFCKMSS